MRKFIAIFIALLSHLSFAQATAVISNISYTTTSITLTATGDLSGYPTPTGYLATGYFSIEYFGNLYTGHDTPNLYSGQLLTVDTPLLGNTGGFTGIDRNYSWIYYDKLASQAFSGSAFTISWNTAELNTTGTGQFHFVWGNPSETNILIQAVDVRNGSVSAVPETETYGMLLAGLAVVGAIARRRNIRNAA
jgi:hypothetical protein